MFENFLKLNDDKTEFMILGNKLHTCKLHVPCIQVGDMKVLPSSQLKNLGVVLDPSLSMDHHVTAVCKAAWRISLKNFGRIRNHTDKATAITMVHAFVSSNKIRTAPSSHITPVLRELHWLPVERRILFNLSLFIYKTLAYSRPAYLHQLLTLYSPSRQDLTFSTHGFLQEHVSRNKWVSRSFFFAAAKIWNNLPSSVRSATSLSTFKKKLKTHLFLDI
ncbi:hypothetical protein HOLleu_23951 [Holothuria leucospilota]|uniref:Uncharacterized protein n=1 Tax=Holothuria leucospilota TaxID=206669 RepID=A0A9Q1BVJ9_HOLLE|nr:hypothetical protein HOLleu_23951 [Holothuria leucospilota]